MNGSMMMMLQKLPTLLMATFKLAGREKKPQMMVVQIPIAVFLPSGLARTNPVQQKYLKILSPLLATVYVMHVMQRKLNGTTKVGSGQ